MKCSNKSLTGKFPQSGWAFRRGKILTGGMMNKDFVKCQSAIIWLYPLGKEKPQKVAELLGSLQIFF